MAIPKSQNFLEETSRLTSPTLAQTLWPTRTLTPAAAWGRDIYLAVAFSLLTALSAQIAIHLPLIPITGQTFGVLLTGVLLGPRLGAMAMLLYLGEGLAGLPVFAEGHTAWTPSVIPVIPTILGPSAGYLFSYPIAAALVGGLAAHGWDRRPLTTLAGMLLSSLVIFALGAAWLSHFFGLQIAWLSGVLPFLPGDIIKALLVAVALPLGWKWIGARR
jgi:biotin transport system substrate-specific component